MNFKTFCDTVQEKLTFETEQSMDWYHDLYIVYKESLALYRQTLDKWIKDFFSESTIETQGWKLKK